VVSFSDRAPKRDDQISTLGRYRLTLSSDLFPDARSLVAMLALRPLDPRVAPNGREAYVEEVAPEFSPSDDIESVLALTSVAIRSPLRDGYEAGLAATADRLVILPLRFAVDDSAMAALEGAVRALLALHEAYQKLVRAPSPEGRNAIAKIRAEQRRLRILAASAARMDAALRTLQAHGLALVVSTWAEDVISFADDVGEAFNTVAEVSIRRIDRSGHLPPKGPRYHPFAL
jgi:hypothetical protein